MPTYKYTRGLVNGQYNINNVLRVDVGTEQIFLAKEIETALPGKIFRVKCSSEEANIIFDETLTAPEIATLDTIIGNHKNNLWGKLWLY